ncbi:MULTISPECIES: hypothetical protein [Nostocaceae]|uniref:hypothetical protein n=1 Tax=Nostocaceae TaxID=1162 RepID=UPI0016834F31|nr:MULTISPECIES: hypothetical protein [Nostocaceae]MBD2476630.1 hypothetical protein [Anabaena sp. FACHB-83]
MRSQHETEIFATLIENYSIAGEYLLEESGSVITKTSLKDITWENLRIKETEMYGMRILGFPELQKDTFDNWISVNTQPSLLSLWINNPKVNLLSRAEYHNLFNQDDHRWSMFYTLTRPGLSDDFSQALIQLTAFCPITPQYGNLLYMERTGNKWETKLSYGLFNQ